RIPVVARVLDFSAIGEHGKGGQPHVDSDHSGTRRERRGLALYAEAHQPAARFTLDGGSLNYALDWTVQLDLDVSRSMHADMTVIQQTAACRMLWKGDAVISAGGAEAREPRLLSA